MRKFSALLIILSSLMPLCASPLRLGLASYSSSFEYAATSALDLVSPALAGNENLIARNEERDRREDERSHDVAVHNALDEGNAIPSRTEFNYTPPLRSDVPYEIVNVESEEISAFVLEWNRDALDYLMLGNRLDLLFILSETEEEQLREYTFSLYDGQSLTVLVNSLVIKGEEDDEIDTISAALIEFFALEMGSISLENFPPYVIASEGDVVFHPVAERILLSTGLHEIHYNASGFEERVESVEIIRGGLLVPDGEMEPSVPLSFFLSSIPYGSTVSLGGDEAIPLPALGTMTMPVILTARHDGFQLLQLQLQQVGDIVSLELKPEWMERSGRVEESKKDMYSALRLALVSLGSTAVVLALSNVYSDVLTSAMSTTLNTAAMGVSLLAILDFFHDASVYYNTAKEVYL